MGIIVQSAMESQGGLIRNVAMPVSRRKFVAVHMLRRGEEKPGWVGSPAREHPATRLLFGWLVGYVALTRWYGFCGFVRVVPSWSL